jgi:hypothetical protein
MLVHVGVALALIAARPAGGNARLQQGPGDVGFVLSRAADDPRGGRAHIDTVQAQSDAFHHVGEVRLAQVRVDVSGTGLHTVVHRFDGSRQIVRIKGDHMRVSVE